MTKIFVDWGSTNCRAFLLDNDGELSDQRRSDIGALSLAQDAFERELQNLLAPWKSDWHNSEIWLAGMVGSRRGWHEVPYVKTPATLTDLYNKAFTVELDWAKSAKIVPGVNFDDSRDQFDVMRGEEVQLAGLCQLSDNDSLFAMLPGTHNKHVQLRNGSIEAFATHPTGELFAVLTQHMLIGYGLADMKGEGSREAFYRGLDTGAHTTQLGKSLFTAWTHRLAGSLRDEDALEYISGILIGNELREFPAQNCVIVSDADIGERYKNACLHLGIKAAQFSGTECFLAGMKAISQ